MREENKKKNNPVKNTENDHLEAGSNKQHTSNSMKLDDEQRVKVLSPTMLVIKRFIRNKLAIAGAAIIVAMFLFSFLGGILMPYSESQVFMSDKIMSKEYAGVSINKDFRYTVYEGKEFPLSARASLISAVNNNEDSFESQGIRYLLTKDAEKLYRISSMEKLSSASVLKGNAIIVPIEGKTVSDAVITGFKDAIANGSDSFELDGTTYFLSKTGRNYDLSVIGELAIASMMIFDVYDANMVLSVNFKLEAEKAMKEGRASFQADNIDYVLESEEETATVYQTVDGVKTPVVNISDLVIQPIVENEFLSIDFKAAIREAVADGQEKVMIPSANGESIEYTIVRKNEQYTIRRDIETQLINIFEPPSSKHLLGTDANGMDILTRLMYGGRISLIIGLIVVVIEIVLGIILGGVAGYFGKWVDNLIMRIVDIFYCIPSMPLIIILGAVMDEYKIDAQVRIYYLMLIMGFLGWPSIARLVRGQILSLREQEFMTATEAMGISIPRRIFKHLIPNVIPQLIVIATMGLGGIILTESTLSFLGLGVKFPLASWGNIMSSVNDVHVMTNYWYAWIPAGALVLLTVLAFNFIGDGLRDAFDPKMKR